MKPVNVNEETSGQPAQAQPGSGAASGSATPFLDAIQNIKEMHADAKYELEKLMRRRGWEHTSSTPGCLWMWVKQLPDGRTAIVDLETAVRFETELCGEHYEDFG